MFVNFKEHRTASSEHRWYRRLDGKWLPTWAMVSIAKFNRRYRSGNGVYNVVAPGIVMKMSDNDNGVFNRQNRHSQW